MHPKDVAALPRSFTRAAAVSYCCDWVLIQFGTLATADVRSERYSKVA